MVDSEDLLSQVWAEFFFFQRLLCQRGVRKGQSWGHFPTSLSAWPIPEAIGPTSGMALLGPAVIQVVLVIE